MTYVIEMEDVTVYLPHSPIGVEYTHYVYSGRTAPHPITGIPQRELIFVGTRDECETYVARRAGRNP